MSEKDNKVYAEIWEELSPTMRENLQHSEDVPHATFTALWNRGLLEPADLFHYQVSSLGKAVLRWAKRTGQIS